MATEVAVEGSILQNVRNALGLDPLETSFDAELLIHINSALATLHQNGIGLACVVKDCNELWDDFKDVLQVEGNVMFEQAKNFVFLKTKILFDPPPPSTIRYMDGASQELLWRLREFYDVLVVEEPIDEEV